MPEIGTSVSYPALERITMIIPWIELARDSAQFAVRLTRAWGVGAHDRAARFRIAHFLRHSTCLFGA
jgi:hypothetical protein